MQKIQVMLDDKLATSLKESAKQVGLSISSYARLLLANAYKKRLSPLEKSLLDTKDDEVMTLEQFNHEMDEMIKNA
ncbi:MAG: hypothetical protein AAGA27_02165 [Pseudomonadota bacterium]